MIENIIQREKMRERREKYRTGNIADNTDPYANLVGGEETEEDTDDGGDSDATTVQDDRWWDNPPVDDI